MALFIHEYDLVALSTQVGKAGEQPCGWECGVEWVGDWHLQLPDISCAGFNTVSVMELHFNIP